MDSCKRMDVFPRGLSSSVSKLTYPNKNFEYFKNECRIFIAYMDRYQKMYYYKLPWTEQYFAHMLKVGRDCQHFNAFEPEKVNWHTIAKRLEKSISQAYKKNADIRIGFKNGDKFLVKSYFTFGQRTVQDGTAHVVQTLNVPLVFYLMHRNCHKKLSVRDGLFHFKYMHMYDRRVLSPNGCFRIPPGTTYVLVSTQKNFFSLDIVRDDYVLSIPHTDPVAVRVRRIVDLYDKPLKTPYIDDVVDKNPELEALFETIRPSRCEFMDYTEHNEPEQCIDEPDINEPEQCIDEPDIHEPEKLIPPIEVPQFEQLPEFIPQPRSVVIANVDFVKNFQRLAWTETSDPRISTFVSDNSIAHPLDLSNKTTVSREDFTPSFIENESFTPSFAENENFTAIDIGHFIDSINFQNSEMDCSNSDLDAFLNSMPEDVSSQLYF